MSDQRRPHLNPEPVGINAYYEQNYARLILLARRQLGHFEMLQGYVSAEDIVQDALVAAWERWDEFDPSAKGADRWVDQFVRNFAANFKRKSARRHRIIGPTKSTSQSEGAIIVEVDFAGPAAFAEFVDGLNPQDETLLRLFVLGQPKSEIAAFIGVSEKAVGKRLQLLLPQLLLALDEDQPS